VGHPIYHGRLYTRLNFFDYFFLGNGCGWLLFGKFLFGGLPFYFFYLIYFGKAGIVLGTVVLIGIAYAAEVGVLGVDGCGLQGVEDERGLFLVDTIGEERVDHVGEGELDGVVVLKDGELQRELAPGGDALATDAVAGGAMEIAEVFVAQCG
jgi:hypothetical protein